MGEATRSPGRIAARTDGDVKCVAATLDGAGRLRACNVRSDSSGKADSRRERKRAKLPYFHVLNPSNTRPKAATMLTGTGEKAIARNIKLRAETRFNARYARFVANERRSGMVAYWFTTFFLRRLSCP
jgi:hypothetical protein